MQPGKHQRQLRVAIACHKQCEIAIRPQQLQRSDFDAPFPNSLQFLLLGVLRQVHGSGGFVTREPRERRETVLDETATQLFRR